MITPSAYRIETTVVPCVTPAGGSLPPPPPPCTGASPTRLSSSAKLGPGSPDGKRGRLIRRETLPVARNYDVETRGRPGVWSVLGPMPPSIDRTPANGNGQRGYSPPFWT